MSYSRQKHNAESRHYLVKEARKFFDNYALSDQEVYKILGHVFEELRNSRNIRSNNVAGAGLAYIYNNHLNSGEKSASGLS